MATDAALPEGLEDPDAPPPEGLEPDDRVALLRYMLLMRGIEERAMNLYRQGKVPGSFYDGFGQEAVSVGSAFAMAAPGPAVRAAPRPRRAPRARRRRRRASSASTWAAPAASRGGRDGNVHFGDRRVGCVGMVSMLPDMMLVATGMAMAFKLRGEARCAITWFGDGSTSRGDFHEAMNWAGVQQLPVVFVLENNQYAYSTPTRGAVRGRPRRARRGLRLPRRDASTATTSRRCSRRRSGRASARWPARADADRGGDDAHARPRRARRHEVRAARAGRGVAPADPVDRQEARLVRLGVDVDALRAEVAAAIDAATEEALAMPMPDPRDRDRRRVLRRRRGPAARRRRRAVERVRAPDADDDLPAGDLRRPARGDARTTSASS